MTECNAQRVLFTLGRRKVTSTFDGGWVSSNAGVVLLSRVDQRMGLTSRLAAALSDERDPARVQHSHEDLLRQRIYQIACGYEDAVDANALRLDPALQTAVGKIEQPLASQPTLSRLEGERGRSDLRRLAEVLLDLYLERLAREGKKAWKRIVLDFDSTDDPTHGAQQLTMFHGFYDQWMYHPLLVFDSRGWPLAVVLRPGNAHDSWGVVAVLRRLVEKIWDRFPKAQIIFRGDAGFATPEIYSFCEHAQIPYVIGQITNPRLLGRAQPWRRRAERVFEKTGEKARVFADFRHRADSWDKSRRIVVKAEHLPKGENPRFVVTTLPMPPEKVYLFYTERGQTENWIKDLKNALFADRLSCHVFSANQFRLLLHTAAYVLMFALRERLARTELASAQMDTLRLKILKVGARVEITARRVWLHLSAAFPLKKLWLVLARDLAAAPAS